MVKVLSLPKLAWQAIASAVILLGGVTAVRCYGGSAYDRGRQEAQVAHTDSVRVRVTAALDSAERAMEPILNRLLQENDSLRDHAAAARRSAQQAGARALRAESMLGAIPREILSGTHPIVAATLDSLRVTSAELRLEVEKLSIANLGLVSMNDSLASEAARWRSVYHDARAVIDTSAKEIAQLKALRQPDKPRFGFGSGFLTGLLTTVAAVVSIVIASR